MNTGRVILVLAAGMLGVCLCFAAVGFIAVRSTGWILGRALEGDPVAVAEAGSRIADYEVPAGFDEGYAADLAGFSLVGYTGADEQSHIYLFQMPAGLSLDQMEMEEQLRRGTGENEWIDLTEVSREPCEIRGQQTTLIIGEGVNGDNVPYRTASALFEGKGGQALVNISMPSASWDQAVVDEFIESLR